VESPNPPSRRPLLFGHYRRSAWENNGESIGEISVISSFPVYDCALQSLSRERDQIERKSAWPARASGPFCLFFCGSFALSRLRSNRDGDAFCPPPEQVLDRHGLKRPSEDITQPETFGVRPDHSQLRLPSVLQEISQDLAPLVRSEATNSRPNSTISLASSISRSLWRVPIDSVDL